MRSAVDRELTTLLPWPAGEHGTMRIGAAEARDAGFPDGTPAMGIVWLSADGGGIEVRSATGSDRWQGTAPVRGTIYVDGPSLDPRHLERIVVKLAARMLAAIAVGLSRAPTPVDEAAALYLRGIALGIVRRDALPHVSLPCFAPRRVLLDELIRHLSSGARVPVAGPGELGDATAALGKDAWVLVRSEQPIARELFAIAGSAAVPWQSVLKSAAGLAASPIAAQAPSPARRPVTTYAAVPPPSTSADAPAASPEVPTPASGAPTKRRAHGLEPMLHATLVAAGVHGIEEVVSMRRKRPFAVLEGSVLRLAGTSPALVRAARALELRSPELDAILAVIAARIGGHLHRREARLGADDELALAIELLRT
jgi:hypothetical protein